MWWSIAWWFFWWWGSWQLPLSMVVCNVVVYSMVVLLVVRELTAAIAGDSVGFSWNFSQRRKIKGDCFPWGGVPTPIADNSHKNDGKNLGGVPQTSNAGRLLNIDWELAQLPPLVWLSSYVISHQLAVAPQSGVKHQFCCSVYYITLNIN